jgi:hypothetical protein
MNDAQSTIVGLKSQDCPGGGWNGMPAELEGKATVSDCLAHRTCGCIYGDVVKHIERQGEALGLARNYSAGRRPQTETELNLLNVIDGVLKMPDYVP